MRGNSLYLRNFIGGQFVDAASSARIDIIDPSSEMVFASSPDSGAEDVERAVRAAAAALTGWSQTTQAVRNAVLLCVADVIEAHAQQLLESEVRNTGKPTETTRHTEVLRSADQLRGIVSNTGVDETMLGHSPTDPSALANQAPRHVVTSVVPWTYPLMLAVARIGPALAAGNTIVLKPSELTPTSLWVFAKLLAEIVPPGVVNVIFGGAETERALLKRAHTATVTLAGKSAAIVFEDVDIEWVSTELANSGYFNAGQDSAAASRILVDARIHDEFLRQLVSVATDTVTGGSHDPMTFYGPLISAEHRERIQKLIAELPAHAVVETGGYPVGTRGFYFAPTVISGVQQDDDIVQAEALGPVITVQRFDTEEGAVALANGAASRGVASIWTDDDALSTRVAGDLDFGLVWVNTHRVAASDATDDGPLDL